jgi:hypothetical protein
MNSADGFSHGMVLSVLYGKAAALKGKNSLVILKRPGLN